MGSCSSTGATGSFEKTYTKGDMLGEGTFAQVYKIKPTKPTKSELLEVPLAVKIIDFSHLARASADAAKKQLSVKHTQLQNEISIWGAVSGSQYCTSLFDSFFDGVRAHLVMEACECSLPSFLLGSPLHSESQAQKMMIDMTAGLVHLHSIGAVHGDVKAENYLIGLDACQTVRLCDFGLARWCRGEGTPLHKVSGTIPYMSPEMLNGEGFDFKTDVWSLGVTLYYFLYGFFPYAPFTDNPTEMKSVIKHGTPKPAYVKHKQCPTSDLSIDVPIEELVRCLLLREVEFRPTAREVLMLPFLQAKAVDRELISENEVFDALDEIYDSYYETISLESTIESSAHVSESCYSSRSKKVPFLFSSGTMESASSTKSGFLYLSKELYKIDEPDHTEVHTLRTSDVSATGVMLSQITVTTL